MHTATALNRCPDEMNGNFIGNHGEIPDSARDRVNALVALIERRTVGTPTPTPTDGDIVIARGLCQGQDVEYYNAHLELSAWFDAPYSFSCCTMPMEPHIDVKGNCQASGGYWFPVDPSTLQYIGTRGKTFWTWGARPTAAAGIRFFAEVNVWELRDNERIY